VRSGRLVFDGACGFCTRSAGWLQAVDRGRRIDLVPLQASGAPESIGASRDECERALQWLAR
jgi:predicted DCC family thiol-disulfide oxidoreductase YuxK